MDDLSERFVRIAHSFPPDIAHLEYLLQQGVDLNALENGDPDNNLLSSIIFDYYDWSFVPTPLRPRTEKTMHLNSRENNAFIQGLKTVVDFFLEHGFQCAQKDDRVGISCLVALCYALPCETILEIQKRLLAACENPIRADEYGETLLDFYAKKASAERCIYDDLESEQYFETMYAIALAAAHHKDYQRIEFYPRCIGKTITHVMLGRDDEAPSETPAFYDTPTFDNCFQGNILFFFGDEALALNAFQGICMNPTLTPLPSPLLEERLSPILGHSVQSFEFQSKDVFLDGIRHHCCTLIFHFENGFSLRTTRSFDEYFDQPDYAYLALYTEC